MARAQELGEQFSALAAGFRQWSSEARESLMLEVRELVGRQIKEMGLATQKQVQAVRSRLDDVERQLRSGTTPRRVRAGRVQRPRANSAVTATKSRAKSTRSRAKPATSRAKSAKPRPRSKSTSNAKSVRSRRSAASPRRSRRAPPASS
jgi:hypothetical protein